MSKPSWLDVVPMEDEEADWETWRWLQSHPDAVAPTDGTEEEE